MVYTPHLPAVAAAVSRRLLGFCVAVAHLPAGTEKAPNRGCFVLFLAVLAAVLPLSRVGVSNL